MKYIISYKNPHQHYIDIEFIADVSAATTTVQLPAWRPGRYELGNFAKNIQKWAAFDEKGNTLLFQKKTKDSWQIESKNAKQIHIKYNYYAAEINAGSSFLDENQLYVNPVNCCVYIPEKMNEKCELTLMLPENYKVASGMNHYDKNENGHSFLLNNFHELVDSPFMASATLKHDSFIVGDVEFNLWFQGECKPDWEKLKTDFSKFCNHQLQMMKVFPVKKYHFLFQILPYKFYHGVEHITSTVIALGPGCSLMKGDLYENLLGVSSHELFHVWNVKTIRPIEMFPYDYSKENYSKLGYVCEGLTTYYGDYLLFRSGVFSEEQYFKTLNERLQKHFDNFGRNNLSVADSSFDTWLDGYSPGIPNRKTNIYDEGNLLAFITDIFIRKNSDNKNSLDDVMRYLNLKFALKNKGYSDLDYKIAVELFANTSYDLIYNNYINGIHNYEPLLVDALNYIGCELILSLSLKFHEKSLGFKILDSAGTIKVSAVYPNSISDSAGMSLNDEIIAVNNIQIKADSTGLNFADWCNYFMDEKIIFTVVRNGIVKNIEMQRDNKSVFYSIAKIQKLKKVEEKQKLNFELWSMNKF